MAKRKRKKYTREFKEEAVKLVTEQSYQVSEAARNLGVHPNMLSRWKREILGDDESSSGMGNLNDVQAELQRLRKENKRLKMEREILKNYRETAFSPVRGETFLMGYNQQDCREERPSAFWCNINPLKNMAHRVLRT